MVKAPYLLMFLLSLMGNHMLTVAFKLPEYTDPGLLEDKRAEGAAYGQRVLRTLDADHFSLARRAEALRWTVEEVSMRREGARATRESHVPFYEAALAALTRALYALTDQISRMEALQLQVEQARANAQTAVDEARERAERLLKVAERERARLLKHVATLEIALKRGATFTLADGRYGS